MYDFLGEVFLSASHNVTVAYGPPYASGLSPLVFLSQNGAAFASAAVTITDIGNGWYNLALTASQLNTVGDLSVRLTATGAADDYYAKAVVVGWNNIFSTTLPNVNTTQWAGFSTATTQQAVSTTAGVSATNVNVISWAGFSAATTQQAISTTAGTSATNVNVISWAGFNTSTTQSAIATTPAVNAIQWAGLTTATTMVAVQATTALTGATNVNVIAWAGAATATTQSAIATTPAVNAIQWAGASTATTQAAISTTPAVNAIQWAGFTTATNQLAVATTLDSNSLAAIWAVAVDGTVTAQESLRLANSANGGILSGATTTAILIRDVGNTKTRITASGDTSGNRTAVTLNLT